MLEKISTPLVEVKKKVLSSQETLPFITFYLESFLFGISAEKVVEINKDLEITPVPLAPPYILGIMNLRGQIITVINLAKKINFNRESKPTLNLILRNQDEIASFVIDRISDIMEIPVIKLEEPPEKIEGLSKEYVEKIYQLPDKLLIILHIEKLFEN